MREVNIQNYQPPLVRKQREMGYITSAENPEFERIYELLDIAMKDQFVVTATEIGISRWEKILKIKPPAGSTLEQRRAAVLARLLSNMPINLEVVRQVVETYLGVPADIHLWWNEDIRTWEEIEEDFDTWDAVSFFNWEDFYMELEPYTILITYKNTIEIADVSPLIRMLYEIIPANLKVVVKFLYKTWEEVEEKYETWEDLEVTTWERIEQGVE